ncbi:MAG: hypothetical protein WD066_09235 [Planctomycetaceae bacterium]
MRGALSRRGELDHLDVADDFSGRRTELARHRAHGPDDVFMSQLPVGINFDGEFLHFRSARSGDLQDLVGQSHERLIVVAEADFAKDQLLESAIGRGDEPKLQDRRLPFRQIVLL